MRNLVLFDIDGTLLRCGPQVRPIFAGALIEVFGSHDGLDGYDFAGKTDPRIVHDLVGGRGHGEREIKALLPRMRELYRERLEAGLRRERMCLLPGVVGLLDRLSRREDVLVGLLTGNWKCCAEVKLERFGLARYFRFGAFGDDAVDRRDLAPVALERAAKIRGRPFATDEALIIGDTVRDVDCARAAGIPALAVATGFTTAESLAAAGADLVFRDLEHAASEVELFSS